MQRGRYEKMRELYLTERKRRRIGAFHWMKIEYYLTKELNDSTTQMPVYGISIIKRYKAIVEVENSGGVSHSYEVVKGMLHSLAKGTITPMVMVEVLDELVTTRLCS